MSNPNIAEAGKDTRFKRGQSGNPAGRAKENPELKALAREHTADAIKTLVEIMRSSRTPAVARVSAANALLDRGWGKATQPVGGDDGGPLTIVFKEYSWPLPKTPLDEPQSDAGVLARQTVAPVHDEPQASTDDQTREAF